MVRFIHLTNMLRFKHCMTRFNHNPSIRYIFQNRAKSTIVNSLKRDIKNGEESKNDLNFTKENKGRDGNLNPSANASQQLKTDKEENFPEEIVIDQGEIKDSNQIFEMAWNNIVSERGDENMNFPKEILFLSGAPGAGKGEMGEYIKKVRGITSPTIETSHLLMSPEAEAIKSNGGLVASRVVVQLLLQKLLDPVFSNSVVVDGFPRTMVQGQCIKHLYDRMIKYNEKYRNTPHQDKFNRPVFNIMVLFIEESLSIDRQLKRGLEVMAHNRRVKETGFGQILAVRKTDQSAELAGQRYLQFKEHIYKSLQVVKAFFNFHFILADSSPAVVKSRILKELQYQSSIELTTETFEKLRKLSLATEIGMNARLKLVRRLENYSRNHSKLFDEVIHVIQKEFLEIIHYNAISGKVLIRSENPLFSKKLALRMAIDLFCERGFDVTLDVQKNQTPVRICRGVIINRHYRVYKFKICFPKPALRHNPQLMI